MIYKHSGEKIFNKNQFIKMSEENNSVEFKFQSCPVKEGGANGCDYKDALVIMRKMLEALNKEFPCRENSVAITKLQEAEHWLEARTKDRVEREVEGYNKA